MYKDEQSRFDLLLSSLLLLSQHLSFSREITRPRNQRFLGAFQETKLLSLDSSILKKAGTISILTFQHLNKQVGDMLGKTEKSKGLGLIIYLQE